MSTPPRRTKGTLGPTTPRGRRKRSALVQAAREVFEEKGFDETRIAEISERANSSYGSFYTYFDSKHDIFRELVKNVIGDIYVESQSRAGEQATPVERIRTATRNYLTAYGKNAKILNVIEQVAARDAYFRDLLHRNRSIFLDRIVAGTERLRADGLIDPDLDIAIAADVLGGMVEHVARMSFVLGHSYDEETLLDTITRLWARGIGLSFP